MYWKRKHGEYPTRISNNKQTLSLNLDTRLQPKVQDLKGSAIFSATMIQYCISTMPFPTT